MKNTKQARRLLLLGALALCFCGRGDIHFTPEEDSDVMKRLELHFSNADGAELTLCEDRTKSDPWTGDEDRCQEAHVVKGGGRGVDHTEAGAGLGCGGCSLSVLAYVKGTWRASASAQPVAVEGSYSLGNLYAPGDVFQYPYQLGLHCSSTSASCLTLSGELKANGTLELTVGDYSSGSKVRLAAAGPSTCVNK